jgi:hypothetical protein
MATYEWRNSVSNRILSPVDTCPDSVTSLVHKSASRSTKPRQISLIVELMRHSDANLPNVVSQYQDQELDIVDEAPKANLRVQCPGSLIGMWQFDDGRSLPFFEKVATRISALWRTHSIVKKCLGLYAHESQRKSGG